MLPIQIVLTIAGKEHSFQVKPLKMRASGRNAIAYGIPPDQMLQIAWNEGYSCLTFDSLKARERAYDDLKWGRLRLVRLLSKGIVGIRLCLYERGWPHLQPRILAVEKWNTDGPPEEYIMSRCPWLQEQTPAFLASGFHPDRRLEPLKKTLHIDFKTDEYRVIIKQQVSDRLCPAAIVILKDSATANQLQRDFSHESAPVIEINDHVKAILINQGEFFQVYGYENLNQKDFKLFTSLGGRSNSTWVKGSKALIVPTTISTLQHHGWKL